MVDSQKDTGSERGRKKERKEGMKEGEQKHKNVLLLLLQKMSALIQTMFQYSQINQ